MPSPLTPGGLSVPPNLVAYRLRHAIVSYWSRPSGSQVSDKTQAISHFVLFTHLEICQLSFLSQTEKEAFGSPKKYISSWQETRARQRERGGGGENASRGANNCSATFNVSCHARSEQHGEHRAVGSQQGPLPNPQLIWQHIFFPQNVDKKVQENKLVKSVSEMKLLRLDTTVEEDQNAGSKNLRKWESIPAKCTKNGSVFAHDKVYWNISLYLCVLFSTSNFPNLLKPPNYNGVDWHSIYFGCISMRRSLEW